MRAINPHVIILACLALLPRLLQGRAEQAVPAFSGPALTVSASPADPGALLDPVASAWRQVQSERIALNRTPRIYETEPPSELEIAEVEVRTARTGGKLMVRLSWRDATENSAKLATAPGTQTEGRFLKVPSEATNRFFDSAAIMIPAPAGTGLATPSLQMGDANDPVTIYYWNAAQGPMLMDARGRETTRRTGQRFPVGALYQGGSWNISFELPDLAPGTPMVFAIWNGNQQDRDGRKYFSIWHWLK